MGRLGLCCQSVNLLCIIGNLNTDIWRYGGSRVWGWVVQVRGRGRLWVVCGFVCICYRDIRLLPICQDLGGLAIFSAVVPHLHSADWVLSGWGSVVNTFSLIPCILVFLVLSGFVLSGYYVSLSFILIIFFILIFFSLIIFSTGGQVFLFVVSSIRCTLLSLAVLGPCSSV
jgi:hypothetical protein